MSGSDINWVCQECGVDRESYDGTLVKKTTGEVLCLECDLDEDNPEDNFEQNLFEIECRECGQIWLTPDQTEDDICIECSE